METSMERLAKDALAKDTRVRVERSVTNKLAQAVLSLTEALRCPKCGGLGKTNVLYECAKCKGTGFRDGVVRE